ncbi:hypothetical protein DSO57_1006158 [Entomophthora muscae]|uniref:Uncharacterized protein n=1 Tax=Entomophthora muscae TaxID=34485 RepID=A0ACC2UTL7_9FUNG|nr:hypothetical protein DSO57_1006158 [Entomophthora muscae]
MEPPTTPKPMPISPNKLPIGYSNKLFGIMYIILSGLIGTIILAANLWSWVAPILWCALPTKNPAHVVPENDGPATQAWIPESFTGKNIVNFYLVS